MKRFGLFVAAGMGLGLFLTGCGGGISTTTPPVTTYALTVNSANPASGVAITVSPADTSGAANGTTSFTRTYDAGTSVTLIAPAKSGANDFGSWTGCTSTSTVTCTVTVNANMSVTANYAAPALITPTVTVTPSATVIASTQAWTVAVAVSGGSGNPTPTGSVTLTSGSYTSTAATLSGGSATINVPAGSLVSGSDTLTVTYTPDSASSSIYSSASGTASVTVPAGTSYVVTVDSVNPSSGVPITQVCITSPCPDVIPPPQFTPFTVVAEAGGSFGLLAPGTAGGNTFAGWAGCTPTPAIGEQCNLTVNGNITVTVVYVTPTTITPTVTVTPSASSVTTAQALTVTVGVSGGTGNPAPTGTVTLSAGTTYSSAPATLSNGSASINVPAGSIPLPAGTFGANFTLTATYTPDTASSSIYGSAQGTSPLKVISGATNVLTVNSADPSSGVSISVSPADNNGATNGTTSFTRTYYAGTPVTLTAPATSGVYAFVSWTGCFSHPSANSCGVNLDANTTVTANYIAPKTTPTVTVTPSASSITTAQALTVTVAVSGGSGNPPPTGSVTLTSGTYTSTSAALTGGSATINVSAGSLAVGSDTLTVVYTPDTASSAIYNGATGTAPVTVTAATTYTLTIDSTAPASGVDIQAIPADINNDGYGPTPLTLTYNPGTAVALTAPATSGGYAFLSWTGCASSSGEGCNVTMNANTTVTANYNKPSVTSITVTPSAATIGTQVQFTANVVGTGSYSKAVTWSLSCPVCGSLSAGTLGTGGLYTTPYPAPASVTVTATSAQSGYTNVSGSATVTLSQPAAAGGPALTVDAGNQTHPISPYIYGMNNYALETSVAKDASITVDRFGGDATSRYNYLLDVTSSASDWYFENQYGNNGQEATSQFNEQVTSDKSVGARTLGTVNVLGWVAKNGTSCSFPVATYPGQQDVDSSRQCGNGVYTSTGDDITGNDPTVTSVQEGPAFAGDWVAYLVGKFGTAANGGVFAFDLDNEPAWWDAVHRDVHPVASTYDEVTNNGIATAEAIKTADPSAAVNGPVVDYWWNYFYSKKDVENGWGTGPCYEPWSGPTDRTAHGGVPFIEYYLQQFAAASTTYGSRLLDYLDMHTYFAADYPAGSGNSVGFGTAGNTGEQEARLNSTRVFWDPTYTDPNDPQPNYITDSNYTASCSTPLQAPQLIPMMQKWVANDYPGTKTAITEYNWGGQESINGAVAQADILGIFGREGLDLGTLWGPPDASTQVPGLKAFEIYRNYDGNKSAFGDTALGSTSVNQGQLAVYGAVRSSDNTLTVMVINKTYGPLTSTLSLANFTSSSGTAQAYLYSSANLNAIVAQPAVTVTPPASGSTTSSISNYTFPAQSITLFVVPQ